METKAKSLLNLRKKTAALTTQENFLFLIVLVVVAGGIGLDLGTDLYNSQSWVHLIIDVVLGALAILGIIYIWIHLAQTRIFHREELLTAIGDAHNWKTQFNSVKDGITDEIELQFKKWKLSPAESEIALYLIKGLSLKEISVLRGTTEKTIRHQTLSVYSKSGVAGRAELAAFFIEDLFYRPSDENAPTTPLN